MNGSETFRALTIAALAACVLATLCPNAEAARVDISGTVTVEGAVCGSIGLEAASKTGRLGYDYVKKDGKYSITVDVAEGGTVVLRPRDDSGWWLRGSKRIAIGQAVAQIPVVARGLELDVHLKWAVTVVRTIKVITEDGRPVGPIPVNCRFEIPTPGQEDIPPQLRQWNVDADDDGSFSVGVPEGVSGSFAFKVDRVGKDSARYVGRKEGALDALRDAPGPTSVIVTRKPLSLEVHCRWDESYSKEPFRPDVGGAIFSHTVVVDGAVHQETLMDRFGVARFYGLPPGEYKADLTDVGKATYSVKQPPTLVKIAPGTDVTIKVDMALAPVKSIQVSGRIVDADNGTPVAGARVTAAERSFAKTSADGRFILEGVIPEGSAITVEHRAYCPAKFEVGEPGEQGDLKVRPLPLFHGTVMRGPKGPGVPKARLMCRATPRSVTAIADEEGHFSTRIRAGKYRLTIKQFYPEDQEAEGRRKVTVYESSLEIPPEGLKQDFIVSGIGEVTIMITNAEGTEKADTKELTACLLRAADGKIFAGYRVNMDDMTVMLAAQPGDYRILVAPNDQMGQVCGDVKIEAGTRKRIAITLGRWVPIRGRDDGTVEVGEQ